MKMNKSWFDSISNDVADVISNIVLRITVGDGDKSISRDVRPDVSVDYDMLEDQLEECPSVLFFYSQMLADQKSKTNIIERQIKIKRSTLVEEFLNNAHQANVNIRRRDIDDLIESDEDLQKLEVQLIISRRTESRLYGIVDAVKMRFDALRSLAGFKREEKKIQSE